MKALLLFLLTAGVIPVDLAAQSEPKARPPTSPVTTPGDLPPSMYRMRVGGQASVGASAPAFELPDANDRRVKLSHYRGDRVVLAFADRGQDLSALGATAESLSTDGVRLVGICRESPRRLRDIAHHDTLRFDLLSDGAGEVSAIYGRYNFTTSSIVPGFVLVDGDGVVRMVVPSALSPSQVLQVTRYDFAGWVRSR